MKIKTIKDEVVYDGKFIRVIRRHFHDTKGNSKIWEMVKRKTLGRIVAIAAITSDKELILEKIYRIPCQCYVYELPAGLMDKLGETERAAISRELLEETGYSVNRIELLASGPFNTGLIPDELAIYLGTDARYAQKPILEGSEDISIVKVPLNKLLSYIEKHKKEKFDLKIASIIPYLQQRRLMKP